MVCVKILERMPERKNNKQRSECHEEKNGKGPKKVSGDVHHAIKIQFIIVNTIMHWHTIGSTTPAKFRPVLRLLARPTIAAL